LKARYNNVWQFDRFDIRERQKDRSEICKHHIQELVAWHSVEMEDAAVSHKICESSFDFSASGYNSHWEQRTLPSEKRLFPGNALIFLICLT
jgi:hypothetical protein